MNTINCPHCGQEVQISEALRHQLEEQVTKEVGEKHKEDLERIKKEAEEKATLRVKEELEIKLKDSQGEINEEKEKSKELRTQLTELMKQLRNLQEKDESREIEMQKRLMEERTKLQEDLSKSIQEKADLEKMELKKQLDDTKKALEDAQRKASQTSQQLQGEVMELNLEELMRTEFEDDEIAAVGKGVTGADIRLIVKTKKGTACGEILIESKRTKAWSEEWVTKLKADVRAQKANAGVIVTSVMPKEFPHDFGFREGIYVSSFAAFMPFLHMLRQKLIEVAYQKFLSQQSGEKADILYEYVTSHEFRQQVESLAEVYQEQLEQITKERAAFERIWKARESQAKRILLSTTSMYGSMQGIVGGSMPQIKSLDMIDEGEKQMDLLDSE